MKQQRIIIVEDDADLRENMVKYLMLIGHDVVGVGSAAECYSHLIQQSWQFAIIDIGLPDQSGLVLTEYIRKNTDMWIIILTARSTLDDKLAGLNAGADFYLVKPIDCRELAALITNLFMRAELVPAILVQEEVPAVESVPDSATALWRLDAHGWRLMSPKGDMIQLTSKEYEFVALLVLRSKNVVSRREILTVLDYPATEQANHALETMVYRLRKKIEGFDCVFPVKTSHGAGYCLADNFLQI